MDTMILLHESDGRAFTLPAAPVARRLRVEAGRAWITHTRPALGQPAADDLWLAAGDGLDLPAGSAWVVQADGELRLRLQPRLCAPALSASPAPWLRVAVWLRAAWPRRQPAL